MLPAGSTVFFPGKPFTFGEKEKRYFCLGTLGSALMSPLRGTWGFPRLFHVIFGPVALGSGLSPARKAPRCPLPLPVLLHPSGVGRACGQRGSFPSPLSRACSGGHRGANLETRRAGAAGWGTPTAATQTLWGWRGDTPGAGRGRG